MGLNAKRIESMKLEAEMRRRPRVSMQRGLKEC
jgi:hypothetical protein